MNDIQAKVWSNLKYKEPGSWLIELSRLEKEVVPQVKRRKKRLLEKWANEAKQAGIFTYGMAQLIEKDISFAMNDVECSDSDFVALFFEAGVVNFVPIQLKEWVPEWLNPTQSLESLYRNLKKYSNQSNLTVAIYVCRSVNLKLADIKLVGTQFAGVWLFGSSTVDKTKWFLLGDIQQEDPRCFVFDYPAG